MKAILAISPLVFRYWLPGALALLWASVQLAVYGHFGPRLAVDSPVYLANAQLLLHGHLPADYSIWYSGYSAFLAAVQALGGGIAQAVGLQIALSGVAALALWRAVRHLSGSAATAYLCVFLYISWFKIHHWNVFIYTESLFTSCCVCCFALLVLARRRWQFGLALLLVGYTFSVRPTGYCLLIGVASYGIAKLRVANINFLVICSLAFALLAVLLGLLNKMLYNYILVESYARAEIIYPGITFGIRPPASLVLPAANQLPILRLLFFIGQNPAYFFELFSIKLVLFLSNIKPYYSWAHNLAVAAILWPLYYFAIRGGRLLPPRCPAAYFIVGFVGAQALMVALTTENWDGRFLVPALPFVFVLAAVGLRAGPLATGSKFIVKLKPYFYNYKTQ